MKDKLVEIKQVSEREIWVGENRLYLGADNILYETLVGQHDLEMVIAIMGAHDKLESLVDGKMNILVDLNNTGTSTSEARKYTQDKLMTEEYGKIALFGMHPVARVIASFFMGDSKKKYLRFFKSKEEALAWLKE